VIFEVTLSGVGITVLVAVVAYLISLVLGLGLALLKSSPWRLVREAATFYIELMRGLPMLVILYYIAFVATPVLAGILNVVLYPLQALGWMEPLSARNIDFTTRAVTALTLGYSAFLAEVFRAGIESVDKGQTEAGLALGMSRWHTLRHIVLPQMLRNVLPALVNESVAMVKDSSLVSILGVADITQLGKVQAAGNFRYFETYNMVALLYLGMTIGLSLGLRRIEARLKLGAR
jgi:polar amino acid transport system permease protein